MAKPIDPAPVALTAAILAREWHGTSPHRAAVAATELHKIERALTRINEANCNIGASDTRDKREDRLYARAREVIRGLAAGCPTDPGPDIVRFGGDPRGSALRLVFPDGRHANTWGGPESGYAIS